MTEDSFANELRNISSPSMRTQFLRWTTTFGFVGALTLLSACADTTQYQPINYALTPHPTQTEYPTMTPEPTINAPATAQAGVKATVESRQTNNTLETDIGKLPEKAKDTSVMVGVKFHDDSYQGNGTILDYPQPNIALMLTVKHLFQDENGQVLQPESISYKQPHIDSNGIVESDPQKPLGIALHPTKDVAVIAIPFVGDSGVKPLGIENITEYFPTDDKLYAPHFGLGFTIEAQENNFTYPFELPAFLYLGGDLVNFSTAITDGISGTVVYQEGGTADAIATSIGRFGELTEYEYIHILQGEIRDLADQALNNMNGVSTPIANP